jgi:hypothetical protein
VGRDCTLKAGPDSTLIDSGGRHDAVRLGQALAAAALKATATPDHDGLEGREAAGRLEGLLAVAA